MVSISNSFYHFSFFLSFLHRPPLSAANSFASSLSHANSFSSSANSINSGGAPKLVQIKEFINNQLFTSQLQIFLFEAVNKLRDERIKQGKKILVSGSTNNDLYSPATATSAGVSLLGCNALSLSKSSEMNALSLISQFPTQPSLYGNDSQFFHIAHHIMNQLFLNILQNELK
jgi:hypothetical protein